MNRQAQAVVLLLLGGAVLKASVTDLYKNYVKEGLQPFLIAASLMLLAAAAMTLWYDLRHGKARDTECADDVDHDHDPAVYDGAAKRRRRGSHAEPRVGWLLLLPVLGLLLVAPPAMGSFAAGQTGTALGTEPVSDFPPLPKGDPAKITVLDYASRAVFDKGKSLENRSVQLTGFVATGPDGKPFLARMMLQCCAADARPIKLGLAGNVPVGLAQDTWIEVVGGYTDQTATDPVNEQTIPYLKVETWQEVQPPKQQYE